MTRSRWRQSAVGGLGALALASMALVSEVDAASCGDTAGPFRTRVPCACGDTVVTSTRLRASDPVVSAPCTSTDEGLVIGANHIWLDCRGLTINGEVPVAGLAPSEVILATGLTGILVERDGVTVQNCTVRFFTDGIAVRGNRNRISANQTFVTLGGIVARGDDNWLVGNRTLNAREAGLLLLGGRRNIVWDNRATECFNGLVVDLDGESTWLSRNVAEHSAQLGIAVLGAHNLLTHNTAFQNGDGEAGPLRGDGIVVIGTGNTLVGNTAKNNDAKGFCVVSGNFGVLNVAHGNGEAPELDFDCEIDTAPASRIE